MTVATDAWADPANNWAGWTGTVWYLSDEECQTCHERIETDRMVGELCIDCYIVEREIRAIMKPDCRSGWWVENQDPPRSLLELWKPTVKVRGPPTMRRWLLPLPAAATGMRYAA